MSKCKFWAAALIAVLLLPEVAASADAAGDAFQKGISYFEKEDYDAAITAFSEAIRLDPKDAKAYYGRAHAYLQKGEKAKADEDFARAKKLGYPAP
jgi:Tfp pilus assembly protein PilF